MLSRDHETDAREWLVDRMREGASANELRVIVDQVAHGVLVNALAAEKAERHRADALEVERDDLRAELARLRAGVAALDDKNEAT